MRVLGLSVMVSSSLACATVRSTAAEPTQDMARTAMELHVAEQAGANYAADSRELCTRGQASLEASRREVFRGNHAEARRLALEGLQYAEQARALAEERGLPGAPVDMVLSTGGSASATLATR